MNEIREWLVGKIKELGIEIKAEEVELGRPVDFCFGDWSSNIALILAKKEKTKPRELAEKIIESENLPEGIEKIEVAGAGFINFYLKKEVLVEEAEKNNYETEFRKKLAEWGHEKGKQKTMIIDYSAPNIAKPFGIGHLRSTNIGQAIYNIYKILGWNCIGDNHLGDWGTQFGKMIVAIKHWANDRKIEDLKIEDLEKLYVKFHQEAEKDEKLDEEAREWFLKLEKGDG
ncbi:arginine--tRNA ligase, partial [Patescibacteria group bacterium]|nr:arginine--tRNA ligase [Patescibacteria group bacterium]